MNDKQQIGKCVWEPLDDENGWHELRIDGRAVGCVSWERRGWVWYPNDEPERPNGKNRHGWKTLRAAKAEGCRESKRKIV